MSNLKSKYNALWVCCFVDLNSIVVVVGRYTNIYIWVACKAVFTVACEITYMLGGWQPSGIRLTMSSWSWSLTELVDRDDE